MGLGIKAVTVLCPVAVTGGPQALHQLAHTFNTLGLPTRIAYYGAGAQMRREGLEIICRPPAENPCFQAYDKYNPVASRGWTLAPDHLVVLPEVRASEFSGLAPARVAVWWLSVDNAFHQKSPLRDENTKAALFEDRSVMHWAPTFYAREFLRREGVPVVPMLSDYVDEQFTTWRTTAPNPEPVIAYNPRKGGELAASFFARHPDLTGRSISGLSRRGVCDALQRARLYVDFGHFPGREFMPREAAGSGAIIFIRNRGAAQFYDDYPLPPEYRYDDVELEDGRLYARVSAAIARPDPAWGRQEQFRQNVRWERVQFLQQAARTIEELR